MHLKAHPKQGTSFFNITGKIERNQCRHQEKCEPLRLGYLTVPCSSVQTITDSLQMGMSDHHTALEGDGFCVPVRNGFWREIQELTPRQQQNKWWCWLKLVRLSRFTVKPVLYRMSWDEKGITPNPLKKRQIIVCNYRWRPKSVFLETCALLWWDKSRLGALGSWDWTQVDLQLKLQCGLKTHSVTFSR